MTSIQKYDSYDLSDQFTSFLSKAFLGSSADQTAQYFSHDAAGNILSRQVENTGNTAAMRTFSYNKLNQLSGGGAAWGERPTPFLQALLVRLYKPLNERFIFGAG